MIICWNLNSFRLVSDSSPPVRAVLSAVRSGHWTPTSLLLSFPLLFSPHRAELDAHRHNRWYSTTDRRSARFSRRSTFISLNFTGTFSITGAGGGLTEDKLDFDGHWIIRLEAEFGLKVSSDDFFFWISVQISESVNSKQSENVMTLIYFLLLSMYLSLFITLTLTI